MLTLDRRTLIQGSAAAALASVGTMMASQMAAAAAGDLYIIAELVAKPDKADALRDLLVSFVAKSRKEPGCKGYVLLEVAGEPGRFLTFETWADKASADVHMTTPDIKAIIPKLPDILAKPFTQIFLNATVA